MSFMASRRQLGRLKSQRWPLALRVVKSRENPFRSPISSAMAQTRGGLYISPTSTLHPSLRLTTSMWDSRLELLNESIIALSAPCQLLLDDTPGVSLAGVTGGVGAGVGASSSARSMSSRSSSLPSAPRFTPWGVVAGVPMLNLAVTFGDAATGFRLDGMPDAC